MRLTNTELCELLAQHGWSITFDRARLEWRASSPFCDQDRVTPDIIRKRAYPFDTYQPFRQIVWHTMDDKRISLFIREAAAPWVNVCTRKATNKAAKAYIEEYSKDALKTA